MKLIIQHKYAFQTISSGVLLVWVAFFDINDIFKQMKLVKEINHLENEKKYYINKIKEVEREKRQVMGSPVLIEKFAREKYLMKRPNEEIFVIVDSENNLLDK
jgi:cell division protein FtsB